MPYEECFTTVPDLEKEGEFARVRVRGVLLKKGSGISMFGRTNWQFRTFTLNPETGVFRYYAEKSTKPRGALQLVPCSTFSEEMPKGRTFRGKSRRASAGELRYFRLDLITEASSGPGHLPGKPRPAFEARARDEGELAEWRAAFTYAINHTKKRAEEELAAHAAGGGELANLLGAKQLQSTKLGRVKTINVDLESDGGEAAPPLDAAALAQPLATQRPAARPQAQPPATRALAGHAKKYAMMRKMKLPRGAIEQKMRAEGLDPAQRVAFRRRRWRRGRPRRHRRRRALPRAAPSPRPRRPARPRRFRPSALKYAMMQKMGLPQGAIEQKMRADGLDPADIGDLATSDGGCAPAAKPGGLANVRWPRGGGAAAPRAAT